MTELIIIQWINNVLFLKHKVTKGSDRTWINSRSQWVSRWRFLSVCTDPAQVSPRFSPSNPAGTHSAFPFLCSVPLSFCCCSSSGAAPKTLKLYNQSHEAFRRSRQTHRPIRLSLLHSVSWWGYKKKDFSFCERTLPPMVFICRTGLLGMSGQGFTSSSGDFFMKERSKKHEKNKDWETIFKKSFKVFWVLVAFF